MTRLSGARGAAAIIEEWPDAGPPVAYFGELARRRGSVWLDSASARPIGHATISTGHGDEGREGGDGAPSGRAEWSLMAAEPSRIFQSWGERWAISGEAPSEGVDDPWAAWREFARQCGCLEPTSHPVELAGGLRIPFCGGLLGYFDYECGGWFEPRLKALFEGLERTAAVPGKRASRLGEPGLSGGFSARTGGLGRPDCWWGCYDRALIWHHPTGRAFRLNGGLTGVEEVAVNPAAVNDCPAIGGGGGLGWASSFTREDYETAVERARAWIATGDVYQVNLAQCFRIPEPPAAELIYRRLRVLNPAPFGAWLDWGRGCLLSSSPERFWEVRSGLVRTCPIKGTRQRSPDPEEDARRRAELATSPKELAELRMIVDLLRNDLGRVCQAGSVRVVTEGRLERFAEVHHRVAEIKGKLREDLSPADLLAASFPGGSITGAPKLRAMEVIAELEGASRGAFCGSLGYFSRCGQADLNILIRTIDWQPHEAKLAVGSGIVWDSTPSEEYRETLAKARAPLAALGVF